jgi:signal transduction histidine kinase
LGLWGVYHLRVRQIAARLNARFDERAAERNRLSSELHDTFLQSVEASKMVADHALIEEPADPERMRRAMETLSGWLARATLDGRAALNTLRSSASVQNNLAEAFQRAAEVSRAAGSMEFTLAVEGAPRAIHPIVRDEVVRIGSEAIRNAGLRSPGGKLEVRIRYRHDLTIRVRDTGGQNVAAAEIAYHAMQDRAIRIGGQVRMFTRPDSGSEFELRVPGRIAFRDATRWKFLAKLIRRN